MKPLKKFKIKEIAEIAGVHPDSVFRWARGEMTPRIGRAKKIAEATGCTLQQIIIPDGENIWNAILNRRPRSKKQ